MSNLLLKQSKIRLSLTFDLEVAFHMYRNNAFNNYRNPYQYEKFSRDREYLQQTELNSAPSYPTSESTTVFNLYFYRLK